MRLSFSRKIWSSLILCCVVLLLVILLASYEFYSSLKTERFNALESAVMLSTSIADKFAGDAINGLMSEEEAKNKSIQVINSLRFDHGNGYIFIINKDGDVVSHPQEKLIGNSLEKIIPGIVRDTYLVSGGFHAYKWDKPGKGQVDKVSFGRVYEKWGWDIATGVYIDDIQKTYHDFLMHLLFFSLLLIVPIVIIVSVINKGVIREIGGELSIVKDLALNISRNDLTSMNKTARFDGNSIIFSLLKMQSNFKNIIKEIQSTIRTVTITSEEVNKANIQLLSRTEEQASALQQTAASMEEIKITVANNAENARQGNVLSHQARTAADNGSTVMGNAVATMDKISQSARKISEINAVVNGIANQTNILALNAAVEAARAGEQGRGFSVVASEVRNLAARSADAAKEISKLINESVKNVDDGAKLIDDAGNTMKEIVTSVTHVTNIMQEITLASEEQSIGVAQIATAVNEMDLSIQQNTTMVEESAVIIQNLNQNAQKLFGIVSIFRIDDSIAGSQE